MFIIRASKFENSIGKLFFTTDVFPDLEPIVEGGSEGWRTVGRCIFVLMEPGQVAELSKVHPKIWVTVGR